MIAASAACEMGGQYFPKSVISYLTMSLKWQERCRLERVIQRQRHVWYYGSRSLSPFNTKPMHYNGWTSVKFLSATLQRQPYIKLQHMNIKLVY